MIAAQIAQMSMTRVATVVAGLALCCTAIMWPASSRGAECELYVQNEKVCVVVDDWTQCAQFPAERREADAAAYRCLLPQFASVGDCGLISIAPNVWLFPKSVRDGKPLAVRRTLVHSNLPPAQRLYDAERIEASCRPTCYPSSLCER